MFKHSSRSLFRSNSGRQSGRSKTIIHRGQSGPDRADWKKQSLVKSPLYTLSICKVVLEEFEYFMAYYSKQHYYVVGQHWRETLFPTSVHYVKDGSHQNENVKDTIQLMSTVVFREILILPAFPAIQLWFQF